MRRENFSAFHDIGVKVDASAFGAAHSGEPLAHRTGCLSGWKLRFLGWRSHTFSKLLWAGKPKAYRYVLGQSHTAKKPIARKHEASGDRPAAGSGVLLLLNLLPAEIMFGSAHSQRNCLSLRFDARQFPLRPTG